MDISVLVVLYACEISECQSIKTFVSSGGARGNVNLIIWNNGPRLLNDSDVEFLKSEGFKGVTIVETTNNLALSKIYNDFINKWPANRYLFLDHDSTLNEKYLDIALGKDEINIGVPLITVDGEVKSPSMNITKENEGGPYTDKDRIVGIGSGIILGKSAIEKLKNHYSNVFDERFYLYGVDTTFFFRVRKSGLNKLIKIITGFEHSLSRLEVESPEKIRFRKFERSYAIGLSTRYYFSQSKFLFIKIIINRLLGRDTLFVRTIYKALVTGKYHRDTI